MAIKPKIKTLTNASVDILNAIRNNASTQYKDYVPVATKDADSIRTIGAILMDNPQLQNEFLSALVNRIGRVVMLSKMYSNPLAMFKKGILEFGETMEEIFVNIAKPFQYDPEVAETNQYKREIPDVRSTFHVINYKKFYKATIEDRQLRPAFLSWDGISELISRVVDSMYTGANYDEFQVTKYMLAKTILAGRLYATTIDEISTENMKSIVATIKEASDNFEFLSNKYNIAGVMNNAMKNEQYILVNTNFNSKMDVEVLASAFNMSKADFIGRKVTVDGFGNIDNDRLAVLFADDDTYVPLTDDELEALNTIPAVLVDGNFFMIYDNLIEFTEKYNGEGLYWNYWYHVWKTFSISPFHNATVFVPTESGVTSVTVSPSTATVTAGQSIGLLATVVTTGFAPQTVVWTSDTEGVTVTNSGIVTVGSDVADETEVTITATSTFDDSVSGTATITVLNPA